MLKLGLSIEDDAVKADADMPPVEDAGRYIIPELWNHKGNRRATRKEVVKY